MKENRGKQYKHNSRTQNSQKLLIRGANRHMYLMKATSYDGLIRLELGFRGGSVVKNLPANAGIMG